MKKKNRIFIYPLLVMGFLLIVTNSCTKDSSKIDPIINWANPADISFGILLSATQLNATANVPGSFVYTPPIGTKLNEGTNQNLKVDFTPTDETNYNTASKTVKINVATPQTGCVSGHFEWGWLNIPYVRLLSKNSSYVKDAPITFEAQYFLFTDVPVGLYDLQFRNRSQTDTVGKISKLVPIQVLGGKTTKVSYTNNWSEYVTGPTNEDGCVP